MAPVAGGTTAPTRCDKVRSGKMGKKDEVGSRMAMTSSAAPLHRTPRPRTSISSATSSKAASTGRSTRTPFRGCHTIPQGRVTAVLVQGGHGAADLLTAITELDYYEFGGDVHLRQYGLVELDPGDGSGSRAAGDTGRNIQAQYERGTDLNCLARYNIA